MQVQRSRIDVFLESLHSELTRVGYRRAIRSVLGEDPDVFLSFALAHKSEAEQQLVDYIVKSKARVKGSTIRFKMGAVKSFLEYHEVPFAWKRVIKTIPPVRRVSSDRAPRIDEIRKLLAVADLRIRVAALMMASGGLRIGAFWFPRATGGFDHMKVMDVHFLETGVAWVSVYRGEVEEYVAFVSREAVEALQAYLDARRRVGEAVSPESPLLRDAFSWGLDGPSASAHPEKAMPARETALATRMLRCWEIAGVRARGTGRGEFKADHGFRKFFENEAKKAVGETLQHPEGLQDHIVSEDVEVLMGHLKHYHKPSVGRLEEVYLKVQPFVLVDERFRVREQMEASEKEHTEKWSETRLQVLELKESNRALAEKLERMEKDGVRLTEIEAELEEIRKERARREAGA